MNKMPVSIYASTVTFCDTATSLIQHVYEAYHISGVVCSL